jgi:hypothetical protein
MKRDDFVFYVVTGTLAAILVAVVVVLLVGLFDPIVDNKAVFAIIGPAFQTVVGVFVGVMSTMVRSKGD